MSPSVATSPTGPTAASGGAPPTALDPSRPRFDVPQSTLSHRMDKLVDAGVVAVECRRRWACHPIDPDTFAEQSAWLS